MLQARGRNGVLALLAGVSLLTAPLVTAAPIAWEGINDPQIRAAQFDLFQGDPFAAITQLKADLKQGHIQQSGAQAQLALGGMYLAYGAHHKAAEIFARLGESNQSQEVRNLAWYQLAQVQYQRGLEDEALAALERIEGDLPVEEQQERLLLAGMLLMQHSRYDEAIAALRQLGKKSLLQQLSEKSVWATYGRFNLGVALFQQGNEKEGRELLEELGNTSADNVEAQALRDKANLTLAFHALSQEDPDLAQRYFIKARLHGPLSSKALLGLGRAYSAKGLYKKALVPWLKLIKADSSDAAVQDGMLAVPFAFGKLNAYKQALQYYQAALASFKNEMEQVREAETAINSGVLVDNLARIVGGQEVKERWLLKQLPDNAGGRYLWPLFATNEFQETLKNYAQMRLSLGRLEQWSSEIDGAKDMAPQQRQQMQSRIGQLQGKLVGMVERLRRHLQQLALKELARRKQRLVGYAGEARFSMAQIYDYAAKRWGGGQ
jgi:tetratricopeptide (TPR) repeat protein